MATQYSLQLVSHYQYDNREMASSLKNIVIRVLTSLKNIINKNQTSLKNFIHIYTFKSIWESSAKAANTHNWMAQAVIM